jgi:hypothetical protein
MTTKENSIEDRQTIQAKTTEKVVIFETFPDIEDLGCLGPGSRSLPVRHRQSFESYTKIFLSLSLLQSGKRAQRRLLS